MRKGTATTLVLVLILALIGAIPSVVFSATIQLGGTITVGYDAGPTGWDPHISTATSSFAHYEIVYESLVRYNNKMEIVPALASSWEMPDPLTYVFHLRRGVKFHHGREMTAEDVKYSMDRWRDPKVATQPDLWAAINAVDIIDKYKILVTMKQVDPGLLSQMAYNKAASIVPRDVVEKHGDLKTVTCGTGPFKVKEYKPELYTIFEKNKDYWEKGIPRVDQLVVKIVKDEAARMAALRTGSLDVGWFIMPQEAKELQKVKGLQVQATDPSRQLKFYLHHSRFPGNNKKLRQAISAALDRRQMIDAILLGDGELSSILPPCAKPYVLSAEEVAKLPFYKRDLELSKRLMKEAGYPNGFEFDITTSTRSPDWTQAMEMVQANLREVGIKANLLQKDWAVHLSDWRKGNFQGMVMAAAWYPTPEGYIDTFFHSKAKQNYFGYANPEVDKLLEESRVTLDMKKRIEIWRKLQQIMAEDVTLIFCYASPSKYEVFRNVVKDYSCLPSNQRVLLREAWIER